MESLLQDVRVSVRGLRHTPMFALTAILTLALGIGLATAVFAVANTFLLRPLPVRDQERVVVLWGATSDGRFDNFPLLLRDAREFATQSQALERVEFFAYGGAQLVPIRDGSTVFRMRRSLVSGGYFALLGARPLLGRALSPDDDVTGAAPVAVLSHGAWQRYFGGDPNVIGRRLVLHRSDVPYTIVGVMPLGLDYPQGTDFWAPVIPNSKPLGNEPVYAELNVIGRLRPGASPADARTELTNFFGRPSAPAWLHGVHGVVHSLADAILGHVKPAVIAFAAAAGLLLLITCINVANLLLVRGLARVREIAVRSALGAGRRRIVGQLLVESAMLAIAGGVLGSVLAGGAARVFTGLAPAGTPRLDEFRLDAGAVGIAVVVTAIVTLLFALAPALVASRVELADALRTGARQTSGSRGFRRGTEALVVGQVALALMVLSAAGLIARSLLALQHVDLSMDASRLTIAELALPSQRYDDPPKQVALLDRMLPRLEAIPGVRAVTPVLTPPFAAVGGIFGQLEAEGQSTEEAAKNPTLIMDVVTPNFFATFGLPVLRGRGFTDADRDGAPRVAIISAAAARHYWPNADPIGKRLVLGPRDGMVTIIGVVPETRYRDLRDPRPTIYFPLHQSSFPVVPLTLAIRADAGATNPIPAIRRALSESEPGVVIASAAPFETLLERPRAETRLNAMLLAAFALGAVALAAVGLYTVVATMVRQRTRELGVRMALGATAGEVGRLVLRRGVSLAALGTSIGLAGALAVNQLLRAMLFEVSPTDAVTLGVVSLALLGIAVLASLVPARSSTRIEPVVALRAD